MNFRNKLECLSLTCLSKIVQCLRERQEPTQVKQLLGAPGLVHKQKARVFAPGKPFQPGLLFAGKAGAYPSETLMRCSSQG